MDMTRGESQLVHIRLYRWKEMDLCSFLILRVIYIWSIDGMRLLLFHRGMLWQPEPSPYTFSQMNSNSFSSLRLTQVLTKYIIQIQTRLMVEMVELYSFLIFAVSSFNSTHKFDRLVQIGRMDLKGMCLISTRPVQRNVYHIEMCQNGFIWTIYLNRKPKLSPGLQ